MVSTVPSTSLLCALATPSRVGALAAAEADPGELPRVAVPPTRIAPGGDYPVTGNDDEPLTNPGKRNRMGSTMVGDRETVHRRLDAVRANEGETPMGADEYLRLSGWVTYRDVEVFEEWEREAEADSLKYFTGDKGIRYVHPLTGIHCTSNEALGLQLVRDARDVGGFRAYMKLIGENRTD